jgi:hypothetical protein
MMNPLADQRVRELLALWLATLAGEPTFYLPDKSVKIGDTWRANRKFCQWILTERPLIRDEAAECKLAKIVKTDHGLVAVIAVSGKCMPPKVEWQNGLYKDVEFATTGSILFNLDKARLESHYIEMKGKSEAMEMTVLRETTVGDRAK